jgi:hypothetical protein
MYASIEKEFDVVRQRGYEATFSIDAEESDGEWGIRLILLEEHNNGNHTVAYRTETPMMDGDWQIGTLEDASNALDEMSSEWDEFKSA